MNKVVFDIETKNTFEDVGKADGLPGGSRRLITPVGVKGACCAGRKSHDLGCGQTGRGTPEPWCFSATSAGDHFQSTGH